MGRKSIGKILARRRRRREVRWSSYKEYSHTLQEIRLKPQIQYPNLHSYSNSSQVGASKVLIYRRCHPSLPHNPYHRTLHIFIRMEVIRVPILTLRLSIRESFNQKQNEKARKRNSQSFYKLTHNQTDNRILPHQNQRTRPSLSSHADQSLQWNTLTSSRTHPVGMTITTPTLPGQISKCLPDLQQKEPKRDQKRRRANLPLKQITDLQGPPKRSYWNDCKGWLNRNPEADWVQGDIDLIAIIREQIARTGVEMGSNLHLKVEISPKRNSRSVHH